YGRTPARWGGRDIRARGAPGSSRSDRSPRRPPRGAAGAPASAGSRGRARARGRRTSAQYKKKRMRRRRPGDPFVRAISSRIVDPGFKMCCRAGRRRVSFRSTVEEPMSQTPRTSLSPVAPKETGFDREQASRDLASIRVPLDEATTLPGRYYHDPVILKEEQSRIFAKMWLCVGREDDLAGPGDYVTRAIGSESVVVVRDAEGRLNGFYNVCRHRGSRLIEEPAGRGLARIQCPYHAWTYDLEGRLK